jgi:hypothetical protein
VQRPDLPPMAVEVDLGRPMRKRATASAGPFLLGWRACPLPLISPGLIGRLRQACVSDRVEKKRKVCDIVLAEP